MKPNSLQLTNIGPFVGTHTVDFSNLDNIYIISGKTGSGKTTILDCITYALYGKLPGSRSNSDKRYLRSDFCAKEEISCIHLDFTVNGKMYRVERTLPYSKTTKKGTQSEENESALFYELTKENDLENELFAALNTSILLESQKSKVDEKIENLLLLSIDEFTRIVLLPQGEFATFLKQNSKDRKGLLIKLFPIALFTRLAEKIKDEKSNLAGNLQEVLTQVNQLKVSFNPETANEEITQLQSTHDEIKKSLDSFQKNIAKLLIEKNTLVEIAKKYEDYINIQEQLAQLEEQSNDMIELERKIHYASEAEKIYPIASNYTIQLSDLSDNESALANCNAQLQLFENERAVLDSEENDQLLYEERLSLLDILLHELLQCLTYKNEIEESEQTQLALNSEMSACSKELTIINENNTVFAQYINDEQNIYHMHEKAIETVQTFSLELLLSQDGALELSEKQALDAYTNAKCIFDDILLQSEQQKLLHSASHLIDSLQDGVPCPVCGSIEHPQPASYENSALDLSERIRMQEKVVLQLDDVMKNYTKDRYILSGKIQEAKKIIPNASIAIASFKTSDEYSIHLESIEKKLEEAKNDLAVQEGTIKKLKEAKEKISLSEQRIQALETQKKSLEIQIAVIEATIDEKKKSLHSVLSKTEKSELSISERIESLNKEKETLLKKTKGFQERKKQTDSNVLIFNEKKLYLSNTISTLKEKIDSTCNELAKAIEASNLLSKKLELITKDTIAKDIDEIKKMIMSTDEKQRALKEIDIHNNETIRLKTLHENIEKELQGNEEDIQKKQIEVQQSIDVQQKELENLQESFTHVQSKMTQLETLQLEYKTTENRRKEIEHDYELYTKLHNVISGNNPKKIPLDSWILGMYLQEITLYANSRLQKMSNGRYELHLKQDAEGGNAYKGLDLEIYDDYTGKSRPTATLSGGETFMASISLALAISDMVQAQNGGIQLDSMFIDEGFGSLDSESLEKALGILDEIRETRTVALISHVETLQSRIVSQIRINKTISGSSIEIHNTL